MCRVHRHPRRRSCEGFDPTNMKTPSLVSWPSELPFRIPVKKRFATTLTASAGDRGGNRNLGGPDVTPQHATAELGIESHPSRPMGQVAEPPCLPLTALVRRSCIDELVRHYRLRNNTMGAKQDTPGWKQGARQRGSQRHLTTTSYVMDNNRA